MTQLTISDELAQNLQAEARSSRCTTEDLLHSMLFRLQRDAAFADAVTPPALAERIVSDLKKVDEGHFTTSEEVDAKFEALFARLRAK